MGRDLGSQATTGRKTTATDLALRKYTWRLIGRCRRSADRLPSVARVKARRREKVCTGLAGERTKGETFTDCSSRSLTKNGSFEGLERQVKAYAEEQPRAYDILDERSRRSPIQ